MPAGFAELEPLVADWALETQAEREARRLKSNSAELRSVYDAIFPYVPRIMEAVDQYPIGQLPAPNMAACFHWRFPSLKLHRTWNSIRGDILVIHDFDERRFDARHGKHRNWTGLHTH